MKILPGTLFYTMASVKLYIGKLLISDSDRILEDYNDLDYELQKYGLTRNGLKVMHAKEDLSARRMTDTEGTKRYQIDEYRWPSPSDFGWCDKYWVVGNCLGAVQSSPGILEKKISDLEKIIQEVRQDIPDATLILASF